MRDYLYSMYFSGDTLSFEISFKNSLTEELKKEWEKDFKAVYSFEGDQKEYPFDRIDYSAESIIGFSIAGTILENRFSNKLNQPYYPHGPVSMKITFYRKNKKLGFRHINIYIQH